MKVARPPMTRTRRKDPVPTDVAMAVFARDGWQCIAPRVDPEAGPCADYDGIAIPFGSTRGLELDHVKKDLRMGKRAEPREDRLVTVCHRHSEKGARGGRQWNTSHRDLERLWLDKHYGGGGYVALMDVHAPGNEQ